MEALTPQQIESIVDENGALYQRDIIKSTFKTRVQGLWTGSGLGLMYGAAIGTVVALSAVFAGVPLMAAAGVASVATMLPEVVGAFALTGMAMGAAMMTSVNASAGAAVGLAKVYDRKRLMENPELALTEAAHYKGTSLANNSELNGSLPFHQGSKKIFNLRAALVFGGFAVAAGAALLALGGPVLLAGISGAIAAHAPAVAAVTAAHGYAATVMGLATCGAFGAFFGIDGPTVAANATQFIGDIFSGKRLGFHHGTLEHAPSVSNAPVKTYATISPEEMAMLEAKLSTGQKTHIESISAQQLQAATNRMTI